MAGKAASDMRTLSKYDGEPQDTTTDTHGVSYVDSHTVVTEDSEVAETAAETAANNNGEVKSSGDDTGSAEEREVQKQSNKGSSTKASILPNEEIPPLPSEPLPAGVPDDDGWAPIWEESAQAFYFYNRFTGATQWNNPRVPEVTAPVLEPSKPPASRTAGGYDPAIHGDYDPNAWYAQPAEPEASQQAELDPASAYAATAAFNRFTGRFQNPDLKPENFNDENKSKRQMNAFFDVDAAANSHDGRSLKEERSGKKLTKAELKKFKEKRKAKKEEKRKAWLRD
jgi:hypothetical protein